MDNIEMVDHGKYDQVKGFVEIDNQNYVKLSKTIRIIGEILKSYYTPAADHLNLVAGCADGQEAYLLNQLYQCKTIGVDISLPQEKNVFGANVELVTQDLGELSFEAERFNLVYSYHVLEHVEDHEKVLNELCRVMKTGACLCIGFPNKHRLVAYLAAHNEVTNLERIKWNLEDYKKRFAGRFENRYGAHAGFSQREFLQDAQKIFKAVIPVRNEYMKLKYANHTVMIDAVIKLRLAEFIFPSNYFVCIK